MWETVGIEFVSREGFNNNDAASVAIKSVSMEGVTPRCCRRFCAEKASNVNKSHQRSTSRPQQVQYQSLKNNKFQQSSTGFGIWFGTRGSTTWVGPCGMSGFRLFGKERGNQAFPRSAAWFSSLAADLHAWRQSEFSFSAAIRRLVPSKHWIHNHLKNLSNFWMNLFLVAALASKSSR